MTKTPLWASGYHIHAAGESAETSTVYRTFYSGDSIPRLALAHEVAAGFVADVIAKLNFKFGWTWIWI